MLWQQVIGFAILGLAVTQLHSVNSQVTTTSCAKNFSLVSDKCLMINNKWLNWYEAERQCRSVGAQLISIQNQNQLQQISKWLNTTLPNTVEFWTSGNKLGNTQQLYFWQSTGEQAKYLPWAAGQPRPNDGDCLVLYSEIKNWVVVGDYKLAVRSNSTWVSSVCEQKPVKTTQRVCLKDASYEMAQVEVN